MRFSDFFGRFISRCLRKSGDGLRNRYGFGRFMWFNNITFVDIGYITFGLLRSSKSNAED